MPSGSGKPQLSLADQLDQDIADYKDFLVGAGKSVSTKLLGSLGDTESVVQDVGGLITGEGTGGSKIQLLPQSSDIEKALGIYNPNPSRAEQGGDIAGSVVDPASWLHGMVVGLGGVRRLYKAGADIDKAVTQPQKIANAAGKTVPVAEITDEFSRHKIPEGVDYNKSYRLGDVLDHPELFTAYPELAETKVQYYKDAASTVQGSYNPGTDRLKLNVANNSDADYLSTILHETQHKIQTIESLPVGTSVTSKLMDAGESPDLRSLVQEQGPRIAEKYKQLVTAGIDPDLAKNKDNLQVQLYHAAVKTYSEARDKVAKAFGEYLQAPGEVQARNTQARKNMTITERNALQPQDTENKTASQIQEMLATIFPSSN